MKRKVAPTSKPTKSSKTYQTTLFPFTGRPAGRGAFTDKSIRICSWNVNGARAWVQKQGPLQFISENHFDILCLNETKIQDKHINKMKSHFKNFPFQYWSCSKAKLGYSGTAILSKSEPINWSEGLSGHPKEGRVILGEFDTFYVLSTYVPNSGATRLDYRLNSWDKDLRKYIKDLQIQKPVIWLGDLNVINLDIDIFRLKGNDKCAGATLEERSSFWKTLEIGLVDSYRLLYPEVRKYSWFNPKDVNARDKEEGWRIDMAVVSHNLVPRIIDSRIYDQVLGSDHHPIEIVIDNN